MTDEIKEPALTAEQAALLASVNATDADLAPPTLDQVDQGGGAQIGGLPATIEDPVEENAAMLQTVLDMATPLLPFLPEIYTPVVVKQIAIAFTKVEQKYGWNVAGKLPPELVLAAVALPPTVKAFMVAKLHLENMKAEARQQAAAAAGGANGNG